MDFSSASRHPESSVQAITTFVTNVIPGEDTRRERLSVMGGELTDKVHWTLHGTDPAEFGLSASALLGTNSAA